MKGEGEGGVQHGGKRSGWEGRWRGEGVEGEGRREGGGDEGWIKEAVCRGMEE